MEKIRIINSEMITVDNIKKFIPRMESNLLQIRNQVWEIINEVKQKGDEAVLNYTKKFDHVQLERKNIKVSKQEIEDAYSEIGEELLKALRFSKQNLIKFHKAQLREEWSIQIHKGVNAGQIFRPLESIGIYVPGGRAIYPSTVLMAATPAYVAGVKRVNLCSPPQKNGQVAPEILVAANELNVENIFKAGGVQAISAMAYGTETIPKVLKIVGPGNKWVNGAKQLLSNVVAIDTPAGPSEILIIVDESADYENVIIDFISQIEHDPDNIGVIVSTSEDLIEYMRKNLINYIEKFPRKEIIKIALENALFIKAKNIDDCIRISNLIAPEHLEILTKNPRMLVEKINNAGAVFLGEKTPVPLGDYSAGTNHILPTGGYAKTYSGLNTLDFIKCIDVLECSQEGLEKLSKAAMLIAKFESLDAHGEAIRQRLIEKK